MAPPNVKIKHITRSPSSSGDTRFPKLDECAHFHYENVELGPIKVLLCDKAAESNKLSLVSGLSADKENEVDKLCFLITVISNSRKWMVRRNYKNFMFLDTQLHRCVYDRKYSLLKELHNLAPEESENDDFEEKVHNLLSEYLERFSQLAGSLISCGPVLNWFELDNRGNRLIVTDEVAINTPAVAAAYVVVPYSAQATDEISFDVGDMISVIDMPPPEESSWWRGKKGFEVGFFPSECVEVIGDKVPHSFKLSNASTKPVFRRHGKLIAFFRSFLLSRPSRRKLKQSGILKERVFGCDLGEHLLNTGREIPMVLKCCAEFIEEFGVVDGIYRLSGVSSNIQRLRLAFDEDRPLNLGDPATVHDIHSVASLLKMYFRELPNPLLTYQLYDKFVSAVQSCEDVRLLRVRDVVQQLPPPHFRTLQYLLQHLARVASHGEQTGMTPKNIAIVWAPNLLRSRDVENGGVGALHVVGVQAVLTEYLIRFSDLIFEEKMSFVPGSEQSEGFMLRARPKSLAISTPTKLLSLEEARARALSTHLPLTQQKYIEVGGGPDKLPSKYHTVIDLPHGKHSLPKLKKSPSGWKSFFSRGWYSGSARDKSRQAFRTSRKASTGSLPHPSTYMQEKTTTETDAPYNHRKKLRTVKSAESLAHCLKEVSHSANKEGSSSNSHKSSPHVSVDSSNSSGVVSPLSKSPGLQKHARSSSHESYFESNSMDIISDPSFEDDDHGLFYYVSEQMRMLQDLSSPWQSESQVQNTISQQSDEVQYDEVDNGGAEKNIRKQKASASDDDVQKLIGPTQESVTSNAQSCQVSDSCGKRSSNSSPVHEMHMTSVPDELDYMWQVGNEDENNSPHESQSLTIDPMVLYDAILNKRSSVPSDMENEINNRTIVERYGNAETVLVEVHATQDSSSEEEPCVNVVEDIRNFPALLKEVVDSSEVSFDQSLDSEVELADVNSDASVESPLKSPSPLVFDDIAMFIVKEEAEYPEIVEIPDNCNTLTKASISEEKSVENASLHCMNETFSSPTEVIRESFYKPSYDKLNSDHSNLNEIQDLPLKSERICELSPDDGIDTNQISSIDALPSPSYPPKTLKLADFQSLKTKIETIPVHKKKHIIIPSPSPVEEVRKKFELQSKKSFESPSSEIKQRPNFRDIIEKQSLETSLPAIESLEAALNAIEEAEKFKSKDSVISKSEILSVNKRYSEPPPKTDSSPLTDSSKRSSNKYESESYVPKTVEKVNKTKATSQQPSLFTQLKIRKLQSLKADTTGPPPEPIDPWSDPILDMQEDYHPVVYSPSFKNEPKDNFDFNDAHNDSYKDDSNVSTTRVQDVSCDKSETNMCETQVVETAPCSVPSVNESDNGLAVSKVVDAVPVLSKGVESTGVGSKTVETSVESEAVKRERINRIKEERRAQLREKLKPESFRLEAEEKEKVQTKFRLRKDCRSTSTEDNSKDVKKSDKAVETDSTEITETGTNCDLSVITDEGKSKGHASDRKSNDFDLSHKIQKEVFKITDEYAQKSKSKKSPRSYDDSRKWLSMPPTDIRDKVAIFERSKETKELCRLGPNGKFIQKQSPSALTSSFVR